MNLRNKNISILDPYSEIPTKNSRPSRYHLIAKVLIENGYNVTLFVSNFSHRTKTKNEYFDTFVEYDNVKYFVIDSLTYKSHISINRILYERRFIRKYISINDLNIDLIIIKDPSIFYFDILNPFIKENKIKYLVDVIDLWPELFEIILPSWLKKYSKYLFYYFYKVRSKLYKGASAITAVSPDYLINAKKNIPNVLSEVIYWGCDYNRINALQQNNNELLSKFNLYKIQSDFWIIYSGTLGDNYDIKSIILAAEKLQSNSNIKFLIAGSGPLTKWIKKSIIEKNLSNVNFFGELSATDLFSLFYYCDIGLTSYVEKSTVSMPIKCYDYFAAGLPIINSLGRNLGKIVEEKNLGYNYKSENVDSLINAIMKAYFSREELVIKKSNVLECALYFDQNKQYLKFNTLVNKLIL